MHHGLSFRRAITHHMLDARRFGSDLQRAGDGENKSRRVQGMPQKSCYHDPFSVFFVIILLRFGAKRVHTFPRIAFYVSFNHAFSYFSA